MELASSDGTSETGGGVAGAPGAGLADWAESGVESEAQRRVQRNRPSMEARKKLGAGGRAFFIDGLFLDKQSEQISLDKSIWSNRFGQIILDSGRDRARIVLRDSVSSGRE